MTSSPFSSGRRQHGQPLYNLSNDQLFIMKYDLIEIPYKKIIIIAFSSLNINIIIFLSLY